MASYSEFFSWARIRGMVSARTWFSATFCSGYPVALGERGIYVGENPRWRVESTVQITDGSGGDCHCWGSVFDYYVRPVLERWYTPRDAVHAYQRDLNERYFSPCND